MNTEHLVILRGLKLFRLIWMLCILFCGLGQMTMQEPWSKRVNDCELMSATKLFGSPLELYHQVLSLSSRWGLLP